MQNLIATGSTLYGVYYTGASSSRISTNTINTFTGLTIYCYYLGGGSVDTLDNNTANNLTATSGSLYGFYGATANTFRVYNNTFQNGLATSTTTGSLFGLYFTTPNNAHIYNNTVRNFKTNYGSGTSYGMYFSTITGTTNIYNNMVSDFGQTSGATSGTGTVYATYFSNATSGTVTANFYNNVLNNFTKKFTGAATATRYLLGLFFATTSNATATYNIIHNTVSINGSDALTSSSAVVHTAPTTATSPVQTWRNNIFANHTGAQTGVAKHFLVYTSASGIIGAASSSSNYNCFYNADSVNNGYFGYSGADKTNLAAWVATTGFTTYEANSNTFSPLFNTAINSRPMSGSPVVNAGSTYFQPLSVDVLPTKALALAFVL
jgi:hypothetical protein